MNCGWARLPTVAATTMDTGTVTSAITASSGEIQNIMTEHADDGQQRGDDLAQRLLQGLRDVVGVVGGPAQHLAPLLLVEVAQRQPGQLRLDLLAQPEHGALHDPRGQPALEQQRTPTPAT